jgi:hypothetical protein
MHKKATMYLSRQRDDDCYRDTQKHNLRCQIRADDEGGVTMHDSFSEGGVYYGRTLALLAGMVALAVVLGQIL